MLFLLSLWVGSNGFTHLSTFFASCQLFLHHEFYLIFLSFFFFRKSTFTNGYEILNRVQRHTSSFWCFDSKIATMLSQKKKPKNKIWSFFVLFSFLFNLVFTPEYWVLVVYVVQVRNWCFYAAVFVFLTCQLFLHHCDLRF